MRALVTGGAGFIGSHLVKELAGAGHEVVVVDNFHTGYPDVLDGVACTLHRCDVADLKVGPRLESFPDVIFHLGMYSASVHYGVDHSRVGEVVLGATELFDFALEHDSKVVLASTSSVYHGLPAPHSEDAVPRPVGLYTEGRVALERLARVYHDRYGLRAAVIRPFSVYGPGSERKGRLANIVNRFVLCSLGRDDPKIFGDGSSRRDFVHVDDVVEAFLAAGRSSMEEFQVYNAGTGTSWSHKGLKALVEDLAGRPVDLEEAPVPPTFPAVTQADTRKARELLGFEARVSLEEGVRGLVDYYGDRP